MRISDWSSDVCSSDLWTPWEVYLRKLGLARGTARSGSRDLRFTNYVQATQAALAGRGVMPGWRSITGDLVAEGRLVAVVDRPLVPHDGYYLVAARRSRAAPESATGDCAALLPWLLPRACPAQQPNTTSHQRSPKTHHAT